ncbi:MAG: hypothetical protein QOF61_1049 [Acidobacteriota bacterium]|jgi:hypothetical protein|nr:hypothetical protein [Acidobacteriota bacterium]
MTSAEVRITGISESKEYILERLRLPFAVIERGDIVIRSPLDPSLPLNDHLVWLWGILNLRRKHLKNLQQQSDIKIVCRCKVPKGSVRLLPNAAEMLHLLSMELVLETR